MKANNQLSKLLITAIGYNKTPIEFAKECGVNFQLLKGIILGNTTQKLSPEDCKKISEKSDVQYDDLLQACGYDNNIHETIVKRGDIFYADLGDGKGSEQNGLRPVCIIQNNTGNKYSPCVIVAAITSKINKYNLPTQVFLSSKDSGLKLDSMIMLEQVRTIDKSRLQSYIVSCNGDTISKINEALQVSFGITIPPKNEESKASELKPRVNYRPSYAVAF